MSFIHNQVGDTQLLEGHPIITGCQGAVPAACRICSMAVSRLFDTVLERESSSSTATALFYIPRPASQYMPVQSQDGHDRAES